MKKNHCPSCGSWEVYYENPAFMGNDKYNCTDCEWQGQEKELCGSFRAFFLKLVRRIMKT